MRKKVSVIIRVYDRIEDLEKNLHIIATLWELHDYSVTVVFNGHDAGYKLTDTVKDHADKIITLEKNAGHLKGNSQLVIEALKQADDDSDYTLLLEADTWLMGDGLIDRYINKMEHTETVWASSEWVESRWSLGLDFILLKTPFVRRADPTLFDYETRPEMYVCEKMMENHYPFTYVKELMPVHRPSAIKDIYHADGGRLRLFPRAKMVTHHIENLAGGMAQKLYLADVCYGKPFFTQTPKLQLRLHNLGYRLLELILKIVPRSAWFEKKKLTFKKA